MDKLKLLKDIFGHSDFRKGQEQAVDCLLGGGDLLAVMPTGAGKSVCYQLPALMMKGITLVISPLISLMQDQAAALTQNGVSAAFLNSSLSSEEYMLTLQMARNGVYKLLYVAPERLDSESFVNFASHTEISMVTVDEAHCISQWGQDFRPSYLRIADFIAALPKKPVISAFTATATDKVRSDIKEKLGLNDPMEIVTGFDRPNLFFEVIKADTKVKPIVLKELLNRFSDRSGIIYCNTRKQTEQVYGFCKEQGVETSIYHAGISDKLRKSNQEDFIYDRTRVMVATNAFGMGIDKSNVGFVIHYSMPKSPEAYYQEAGRAGRDGTAADCVLLYCGADLNTALYFIDNMEGEGLTPEELAEVKKQDRKRLDAMVEYCNTTDCLREFLLNYFGEKCESCSGCSNCNGDFRIEDITDPSQRIISCIYRLSERGKRFGTNMVADILKGSRAQKVINGGFDKLSTFGIMSNYDKKRISELIDILVKQEYLRRSDDEYRILYITQKGDKAIRERQKITAKFLVRRETVSELFRGSITLKNPAASQLTDDDTELLKQLKELRFTLAKMSRLPAYMVFSNATLEDMAVKRPVTKGEFLQVNGVGEAKLNMYGEKFIEKIKEFNKSEQREGKSAERSHTHTNDSYGNEDYDRELFRELKLLMNAIKKEQGSPLCFTDTTLRSIAAKMPLNKTEFMRISGVGEQKFDAFGNRFIEKIKEYL